MNESELNNKIDRALEREPEFQLSIGFTERVVNLIEARQHSSSRKWEIFWIGFAGILFFVATGVSIYLTGFKPSFKAFPFLTNHIGLIAFGLVFITVINWVGKKALKVA